MQIAMTNKKGQCLHLGFCLNSTVRLQLHRLLKTGQRALKGVAYEGPHIFSLLGLLQKWNLQSVYLKSPDHEVNHLPDTPQPSPKGKKLGHNQPPFLPTLRSWFLLPPAYTIFHFGQACVLAFRCQEPRAGLRSGCQGGSLERLQLLTGR